jgi:hypothetical protein
MCSAFSRPQLTGLLAATLLRPVPSAESDKLLRRILDREQVLGGILSPVNQAYAILAPHITKWAGAHLSFIALSGSCAKGTANRSTNDLDIMISLRSECEISLEEICLSLKSYLQARGLPAKLQNVSVGTSIGTLNVDLVPARQRSFWTNDHSLYHKRTGTWKKTNVYKHLEIVGKSGRCDEIRLLKLWRDQRGLDFPSFYLELSVIQALKEVWIGTLSTNMLRVLDYLASEFASARITDPANLSNIISDDLTAVAKSRISSAARVSLMTNWAGFVR